MVERTLGGSVLAVAMTPDTLTHFWRERFASQNDAEEASLFARSSTGEKAIPLADLSAGIPHLPKMCQSVSMTRGVGLCSRCLFVRPLYLDVLLFSLYVNPARR